MYNDLVISFSNARITKLLLRSCSIDLLFGLMTLVRQEKLFSHVAVDVPIVNAATKCQWVQQWESLSVIINDTHSFAELTVSWKFLAKEV